LEGIFDLTWAFPNYTETREALMSRPQDISEFKDSILASEDIHALVKEELGKEADEKWAAFQRGENLDDLYDLISDNGTCFGEEVGGFEGAAPDNDTFPISIWRVGPLFFVTANEFDDLKYFGSLKDADDYAGDYFSSFIEELNERMKEEDDGWEEIASADDDVSQELLEWAGLDRIWDKYHLRELENFQDLAKRSDHFIIEGEEWGGDTPGLSGVWQTAKTDNGEALKEELRNLIAELIWENRQQIHQYSKEFGKMP
jgi:hypothetical protein